MLDVLGKCLIIAAIVTSVVLGVVAKPFLSSIVLCGAIFLVGYVFVRLHRLLELLETGGAKMAVAIVLLIIPYSVLSAIGYGIGRLFS